MYTKAKRNCIGIQHIEVSGRGVRSLHTEAWLIPEVFFIGDEAWMIWGAVVHEDKIRKRHNNWVMR